jgi:hypothetical protein
LAAIYVAGILFGAMLGLPLFLLTKNASLALVTFVVIGLVGGISGGINTARLDSNDPGGQRQEMHGFLSVLGRGLAVSLLTGTLGGVIWLLAEREVQPSLIFAGACAVGGFIVGIISRSLGSIMPPEHWWGPR